MRWHQDGISFGLSSPGPIGHCERDGFVPLLPTSASACDDHMYGPEGQGTPWPWGAAEGGGGDIPRQSIPGKKGKTDSGFRREEGT